jgi:protein ImuB
MPEPARSLALFGPETRRESAQSPECPRHKLELWLAVRLTNLALDSLAVSGGEPTAVVEPLRGQIRVVAVNETARRAGIEPGAKLSTALALARSLRVLDRSRAAERAVLEALATWTQKFTPRVSIELPESLLLEVSGSLRLFHGLAAIKAEFGDELKRRKLTFSICAAPTALGALWLVLGAGEEVFALEELVGHLSVLPLQATRWPDSVQTLLRQSGARTVGDCLRLPRDGFARRVGESYLRDLDKATGRRFDLRPEFPAPKHWQSAIEFAEEISKFECLLGALEQMLDELVANLRRQQCQTPRLGLSFIHARRPPTIEALELVEPSHERERLSNLLIDRLERIALPAPVLALRLSAGPLEPISSGEPKLFEKRAATMSAAALLERLQGRFGAGGVFGLRTRAEHRPECAWGRRASLGGERDETPAALWLSGRPLWMLPAPLLLVSAAARRYYRGSVQLRSGPERIESGWWDGGDVSRDYYTAVSSCGQRLWIYRDRRKNDWHLQGLFG